jgi:hypothetical protein
MKTVDLRQAISGLHDGKVSDRDLQLRGIVKRLTRCCCRVSQHSWRVWRRALVVLVCADFARYAPRSERLLHGRSYQSRGLLLMDSQSNVCLSFLSKRGQMYARDVDFMANCEW